MFDIDKAEFWEEHFRTALIYLTAEKLRFLIDINDETIKRIGKEDDWDKEERIRNYREVKEVLQKRLETDLKVSEENEKSSSPNLNSIYLIGVIVLLIIFIFKR